MYLDTDIIVHGDLDSIFNIVKDDLLYVLEEGRIDSDLDYWGKKLFGDELSKYENKSAFSSGIMVFNNCDQMKFLFQRVNEDMKRRYYVFECHDQPYIVYNAFKHQLFNNQLLKSYAINIDSNFTRSYTNVTSDKILHHFPGGPGVYTNKIAIMKEFLYSLKNHTIAHNIEQTKRFIDQQLLPIILNIGERLEGNIFMLHHTVTYTDVYSQKAKNISNLVLDTNIRNVMEIGFNAGFSALLMLISNPHIKLTCFDLGEHKYTIPCYQKIKETYGDRINLILGDSTQTLRKLGDECVFDLIHIDGGHATEVAESDIRQSYRLSTQGTILIMDDYDFHNLHALWDRYIDLYQLKPLNILLYQSPHHDIKYVSNKSSSK